jgi:hypothetical protein
MGLPLYRGPSLAWANPGGGGLPVLPKLPSDSAINRQVVAAARVQRGRGEWNASEGSNNCAQNRQTTRVFLQNCVPPSGRDACQLRSLLVPTVRVLDNVLYQ